MSRLPFIREKGLAAPLPAANIDTDVIMPKQFLKRTDRAGLKDGVFHDLRFAPDGSVIPDFVLNQSRHAGARFLVTGANFGCGSSREHAVWGLMQLGIRAIIAESFSGIFFDNAARNGLLLIVLPKADAASLLDHIRTCTVPELDIDLQAEQINPCGISALQFDIEPSRKSLLLEGLDSIELTLRKASAIKRFERAHLLANPWLSAESEEQ